MATVIADKVSHIIEKLCDNLEHALTQFAGYVKQLEDNHFIPVDSETCNAITNLSLKCQGLNDDLQKYSLFNPDLADVVSEVDDCIQEAADRFLKLSRTRKLMDTREAMQTYNRSRSTIYRWIKQGKLEAIKVNGRWVIATQ